MEPHTDTATMSPMQNRRSRVPFSYSRRYWNKRDSFMKAVEEM